MVLIYPSAPRNSGSSSGMSFFVSSTGHCEGALPPCMEEKATYRFDGKSYESAE